MYKGSGAIPKGGGRYKVGSPYQIAGRWYTPREQPNYDRVGIASWYGPKFHRRKTANGEWFDMNQMTAAHPTLPIPGFARVTNLKNGRSVIVRINDRGPYAHDRIIDMSKLAARRLDMIRNGTARVRVQYLGSAPLSAYARNYYAPYGRPILTAKADRRPTRRTTIQRRRYVASNRSARTGQPRNLVPYRSDFNRTAPAPSTSRHVPGGLYIQAASYSNHSNAMRAKTILAGIGPVEMTRVEVGARAFYRVRVGPLVTRSAANSKLAQVMDAGHRDARIVAD